MSFTNTVRKISLISTQQNILPGDRNITHVERAEQNVIRTKQIVERAELKPHKNQNLIRIKTS